MPRAEPHRELETYTWPPGWRSDWQVREDASPKAQAWHRTGICVLFEFEQVDERGNWAWLVYDDVIAAGRSHELRASMGEKAFAELWSVLEQQAKVLWRELGYRDFSLA
jgi:hypothetical protein